MKRKLGMNMGFIGGIPQTEQLKMAHEAGFESFFTGSQDQNNIAALRALADQLGMEFETIHAPFGGINNMWTAGMDYLNVYKGMRHSIDLAADNGVPAVVTHVSSGWYPPGINDLGLQRFDEIVLYAADKGVKLAFENLRCIGNLAYFADRYEKLDTVGFCYDIRLKMRIGYNSLLSYEMKDENTIILRREKVCDHCSDHGVKEGSILDVVNSLTETEQKALHRYLSIKLSTGKEHR